MEIHEAMVADNFMTTMTHQRALLCTIRIWDLKNLEKAYIKKISSRHAKVAHFLDLVVGDNITDLFCNNCLDQDEFFAKSDTVVKDDMYKGEAARWKSDTARGGWGKFFANMHEYEDYCPWCMKANMTVFTVQEGIYAGERACEDCWKMHGTSGIACDDWAAEENLSSRI